MTEQMLPFDSREGKIWYDGALTEWAQVQCHILTHALHYASCVFEGARAYNGRIYCMQEHNERLHKSAEMLDFTIPYSVEEINQACMETLAANELTDAYVRPVAWRGSEMMGVSAQHTKIHLAIAVWAWPSYFNPEERKKGIRLCFADWKRPSPETAPCQSKAAGLYMICTLARHKAEKNGYADALMLDWKGRIAETTGANIFFYDGNKLHTPVADCFLDGITRRSVMALARQAGVEVVERAIMPEELSGFSECFITGTAAEVTAVSEIGEYRFTPSALTEQMMTGYDGLVQAPSDYAGRGVEAKRVAS